MSKQSLIDKLNALKTKLETTIHEFETNDQNYDYNGDGIIGQGENITPDEQKIIDEIKAEVAQATDDITIWHKQHQNERDLTPKKEEPDDDTQKSQPQDQDDKDKPNRSSDDKPKTEVESKTTLTTEVDARITLQDATVTASAALKKEWNITPPSIPIVAGVDLALSFGIAIEGKVEGLANVNWVNPSGEFTVGVGASLTGSIGIGLVFAKIVKAEAKPSLTIAASIENKFIINRDGWELQLGNLKGSITGAIEFSLGPSGEISSILGDTLSEHLTVSYTTPSAEFLVMESKQGEFRKNMFMPTDLTFKEGSTIIALRKKMEEYKKAIEDIADQIKNGLLQVSDVLAQSFTSISNVMDYWSTGLSSAVSYTTNSISSAYHDLEIKKLQISLNKRRYVAGEKITVTVDMELIDDDWFYNDTHEANSYLSLTNKKFRKSLKVQKTFEVGGSGSKNKKQIVYYITIPANIEAEVSSDTWTLSLWIQFNENKQQEGNWNYTNFMIVPREGAPSLNR